LANADYEIIDAEPSQIADAAAAWFDAIWVDVGRGRDCRETPTNDQPGDQLIGDENEGGRVSRICRIFGGNRGRVA
jgi:hypothetical protein